MNRRLFTIALSAAAALVILAAAAAAPTLYSKVLHQSRNAVAAPAGWKLERVVALPTLDARAFGVRNGIPTRSGIFAQLNRGGQAGVVTWYFTIDTSEAADFVDTAAIQPNAPVTSTAVPGVANGWVLATGAALTNVGSLIIEVIPDMAAPGQGDPAQAAALLKFGVRWLRQAERG